MLKFISLHPQMRMLKSLDMFNILGSLEKCCVPLKDMPHLTLYLCTQKADFAAFCCIFKENYKSQPMQVIFINWYFNGLYICLMLEHLSLTQKAQCF